MRLLLLKYFYKILALVFIKYIHESFVLLTVTNPLNGGRSGAPSLSR